LNDEETMLPTSVSIHEVGPREGFQFEKGPISTDRKIELVDALSETGLKRIQVTSFVSPKWVPQMSDAEEITARFKKVPGVSYNALFLNDRGLERVLATGVYDVEGYLTTVASDIFCQKNTNKTIEESIAAIPSRIALYQQHGIRARGVSMMAAFGCNYQGDVPLEQVLRLTQVGIDIAAEHGERIETVRLSDTMGWANPLQMKRTIAAVQDRWPALSIALHLHDTRGTAMANAFAALELGVADFDSSVGGLGGCPFAKHKGSAGNIVTEDLVFMCEEMGVETGVDLDKMIECAALAEDVVGHPLPSKLLRGGSLNAIRRVSQPAMRA
jgi:hydroxymethylglutaryl-CoA lyase